MIREIDRDFYCSANCHSQGFCYLCPNCDPFPCKKRCVSYHRKWPTPGQFQEEYGKEYPDDGAVYFLEFFGGHSYAPNWVCRTLKEANGIGGHYAGKIVCACTPFGKPLDDWRPAGREDGHGQE